MLSGLRNGSVYVLANVLNAAIPLMLLPVLTRILTPEEYGLVAMFAVVLSFFIAFCGLGINGAITVQFFKLSKQEFREFVFSCLLVLVASSLVLSALLGLFAKDLSFFTLLPPEWLYVALVMGFFQFLITIRLSIFQAQKRAVNFGVVQVFLSLMNACLSILLVTTIFASWEGRVVGHGIAIVVVSLICLFWIIRDREVKTTFSLRWIREALRFGLPLMPHIIGGIVISLADRTIVANLLGEKEVGIYMVGIQLGLAMSFLADAFMKTYSPIMYKWLGSDSDIARRRVVGVTYICLLGFPLLVMPVYFIIKLLFPVLVGDGFERSMELVIWFLLGHAFTGVYYSISNFYFFAGKTGRLSVVTTLVGGITVVSSFLAIQEYGLVGGAVVFCLGQLALFVAAFIMSLQVLQLPWTEFGKVYSELGLPKLFRV